MRVAIQRVKRASVEVGGHSIAAIQKGLLLFVGIGRDDSEQDMERLAKKVAGMRIFEDAQGKMNLSVKDIDGRILSVPQFTLYADTRKGNRPGFDLSAGSEIARERWHRFNSLLSRCGIGVEEGRFGAHMEIGLINDGPVTIWLDSKDY